MSGRLEDVSLCMRVCVCMCVRITGEKKLSGEDVKDDNVHEYSNARNESRKK